MAGVAMWNAFQVILVLGLSLPEPTSRRNLSHDFTWPEPRRLHVGDCGFGDALLFVARIEDLREVAKPDVVSLAISRSRIVNLDKELGLPSVTDLCRI